MARMQRRRSSRDRFANKVLGRLYESRSFTAGLVFSRGHFLGDVAKMVAGLLAKKDVYDDNQRASTRQDSIASKDAYESSYGGPPVVVDKVKDDVVHTSTLAAGK